MRKFTAKRLISLALALVMLLAVLMQAGCGDKPAETTKPNETTKAPETDAPATEAPATEAPATEAPETESPATEAPATEAPATEAPATEAPATEAPGKETTEIPTPETEAPATEAPATKAPATKAPATEAPATEAPATEAPATEEPTTEAPETEVPETTPAIVINNIIYDLDGGIGGGNPSAYANGDEIVIDKIPVKVGYDFLGWTGAGIEVPTREIRITPENAGDLIFKANWTESENVLASESLDETHFGKDDSITAKEGEVALSEPDYTGARGEGIFFLKTVYTDVAIDGVMDAAYTYGLRFRSSISSDANFYNNREPAYFDVYMIRDQRGNLNLFINVVDPDIVVNEYIFKTLGLNYHCDCLDFYYEYGNIGQGCEVYKFMADETRTFRAKVPENTKILMTETGYVIETRIDNDGAPFNEFDELGFSFFLNETREWNEETKTYARTIVKNHSVLNPIGSDYKAPSPAIQDAVRVTLESATGNVDIEAEKAEKTGDMLTDIVSGAASVLITYDEYATAQTIIAAKSIKNILCGAGAEVMIQPEKLIAPGITTDYEILLGKTSREESQELVSAVQYNEYGVAILNDKILLYGWNEENANAAYSIFVEILEEVVFYGADTSSFDVLYSGVNEKLASGNALKLEGFDSITDVGEDAYLIYKLESTMDEYEAYCAQLVEGGYTLYTTNVMSKVHCATYYNDDTVVNVQFANGGKKSFSNIAPDKSLRIVVEPLSNTELPSLEKPEDAESDVARTSFTQMYPHNLCLVIQLSNGNFIVIDSGNNGKQKELSDFLRSKAPDPDNVIIEAWIFTHFHQDHIGGFIDYMGISSLTRYITVESVIYNFPQWQVLNTASPNDINNLNIWYNLRKPDMEEKGTTFYQARTGQKYYFGNAEIEILWTFEDIMPCNIFVDSTNRTDIGFTVTIEGQKIMVTGDSAEDEFRMAEYKFGKYLKSDILQLSHHGGGNGLGNHNLYTLVDAPVLFHPNPSKNTLGANEKKAVQNAELVIRSGNYGTATIYLPFTVGDPIEYDSTKFTPVEENGK